MLFRSSFSIIGYKKILNTVPCATQYDLVKYLEESVMISAIYFETDQKIRTSDGSMID